MSRYFSISSGYSGGSWFDPLSGTWFYPNKETEVKDTADFTNINKYVNRNILIEIKTPTIQKKTDPEGVTRTSANKLLSKEIGNRLYETPSTKIIKEPEPEQKKKGRPKKKEE